MASSRLSPSTCVKPQPRAERVLWGALWVSESELSGRIEHLVNDNLLPVLFTTRRAARQWIEDHYGYIRDRADLRAEPHGWRVPRAIRVCVRAAA